MFVDLFSTFQSDRSDGNIAILVGLGQLRQSFNNGRDVCLRFVCTTSARELFDDPSLGMFGGVVSTKEWVSEKHYTDLYDRLWEDSISQIGYNTILSFLTVMNDPLIYEDIDELVRLEHSLNAR